MHSKKAVQTELKTKSEAAKVKEINNEKRILLRQQQCTHTHTDRAHRVINIDMHTDTDTNTDTCSDTDTKQ